MDIQRDPLPRLPRTGENVMVVVPVFIALMTAIAAHMPWLAALLAVLLVIVGED